MIRARPRHPRSVDAFLPQTPIIGVKGWAGGFSGRWIAKRQARLRLRRDRVVAAPDSDVDIWDITIEWARRSRHRQLTTDNPDNCFIDYFRRVSTEEYGKVSSTSD